nr:uncharacterized mitochondrial protein AtMg00810-like [Tanacetum cinerariifolium]
PSFVNAASPSPINADGYPASTNAFEEHPFERFSPFKNAFSLLHVPIVTPRNDTEIFGQPKKKKEPEQEYIPIPICTTDPLISEGLKDSVTKHISSTNSFNTVSLPVNTARPSFVNAASPSPINADGYPASTNAFEEHPFERFSPFKNAFSLLHVPIVTPRNDTEIFGNAYDDEAVEEEVDMNNVVLSYIILDVPLTKFLKDHPEDEVIGSIETLVQTRQMTKINEEDVQALKDPSWVEAMQDELLQFKLLNVWTLVDLPKDMWAIGTKWVFRNKKDEKDIVIKNKARLVAQGHTQEEASRPDITFSVCACVRFQVTPKTSHLHVVKRIFRYLKGQPKLGFWYPKDSPFNLEAYFGSEYAGASLDRKSTI